MHIAIINALFLFIFHLRLHRSPRLSLKPHALPQRLHGLEPARAHVAEVISKRASSPATEYWAEGVGVVLPLDPSEVQAVLVDAPEERGVLFGLPGVAAIAAGLGGERSLLHDLLDAGGVVLRGNAPLQVVGASAKLSRRELA